ncbi:MAG TPA: hypothetical protein P5572_04335 [Phycisphaerae bacterium]|nr:hypothetical protein [Phycisphaerae bacterium]
MLRTRRPLLSLTLVGIVLFAAAQARGWGEEGHAIITELAFDKLPAGLPDWLKTPEVRARLRYLSSEPDRWRGQNDPVLNHLNGPDHYIDVEKLEPYGLTLENLPRFRTEYTDVMATLRAQSPDKFEKRNPAKDKDYTELSPGLLPYAIEENFLKIAASWTQLKTFEKYPDLVTPDMIANERENIIYHMGILSHFVDDGAQPLHLTKHHHGWEGPNPHGYTTDHHFHAYIDSGVINDHHIYYETLAGRAQDPRRFAPQDPWKDINAYLMETFKLVEPLYALEQSGELKKAEGKTFIEDRLVTGGSALAGLWTAAYYAGKIDDYRVRQLQGNPPKSVPGHAPQAVGAGAAREN